MPWHRQREHVQPTRMNRVPCPVLGRLGEQQGGVTTARPVNASGDEPALTASRRPARRGSLEPSPSALETACRLRRSLEPGCPESHLVKEMSHLPRGWNCDARRQW